MLSQFNDLFKSFVCKTVFLSAHLTVLCVCFFSFPFELALVHCNDFVFPDYLADKKNPTLTHTKQLKRRLLRL